MVTTTVKIDSKLHEEISEIVKKATAVKPVMSIL